MCQLSTVLRLFVLLIAPIAVACSGEGKVQSEKQQQLESKVAELQKQSGDRPVRVMLRVSTPQSTLTADLQSAQSRLIKETKDAGALLAEPLPDQPLVVVEMQPSALRKIIATGLVEQIYEDQPAKAQ